MRFPPKKQDKEKKKDKDNERTVTDSDLYFLQHTRMSTAVIFPCTPAKKKYTRLWRMCDHPMLRKFFLPLPPLPMLLFEKNVWSMIIRLRQATYE